jgi:hypothetical protein
MHTLPSQGFALLASAAQCAQPCISDLGTEGFHRFAVAWDAVVIKVSLNNPP